MSAKIATLGLLEIKIFWSKDYDVIFFPMTSPKNYHVSQFIL